MIQTIFKHKAFIIIIMIVCMVAAFSFDFILKYNKMTMTLTLNYEGTERGLYPNGTRFNIFEIVSDEVLDSTLKKLQMRDMTADNLRNRIDFYAKNTTRDASYVKSVIESGKDYSYVPNEYTISYSQKNKVSKNRTRDVLRALTESYRDYFIQNYTEKATVLEYENIDTSKLEYIEIAELYTDKINSVIYYLRSHLAENPTFRSDTTGQTFEDLIVKLDNLNTIDVTKYRAYIVSSGITRNKAEFLNKLNYKKSSYHFDYLRSLNRKNAFINAINEYDPRVIDIVFIPTRDSSREYYMNRTKIGLDYLIDAGYYYGIEVQDIVKDNNSNSFWINSFSSADEASMHQNGTVKTAEEMLISLDAKLSKLMKTAASTDEDYTRYKTRDYLKFAIPEYSFTNLIDLKNIILYGLLGFFASVFLILLREYRMNRRARKWQ